MTPLQMQMGQMAETERLREALQLVAEGINTAVDHRFIWTPAEMLEHLWGIPAIAVRAIRPEDEEE